MIIKLSPIASDHTTSVSVNGLIITVDGTDYDFSQIPEGGSADVDENSPFTGTVTREQVTVKYHYESIKAEPNQSTDWDDYIFDIESGDVPCPIKWKPEPVAEGEVE